MAVTEGAPGSETGPYLQWELRAEPIPDHPGTERWWFQDAVVLHAPDGAVRWRRELPARSRDWQIGIGNSEAEGHRDYPRTIHNLYQVIGLSWTDDAVAFADVTGALVLARADGAVLLDAPSRQPEEGVDSLWFDSGSVTLLDANRAEACTGKARGGRFFAKCGGEWLYFNGRELVSIDIATRRVSGTAVYDRAKHLTNGKAPSISATIPLGKRRVRIDGVIFLR